MVFYAGQHSVQFRRPRYCVRELRDGRNGEISRRILSLFLTSRLSDNARQSKSSDLRSRSLIRC